MSTMSHHLFSPYASVHDGDVSELNCSSLSQQKVEGLHPLSAPIETAHFYTPSSSNLNKLVAAGVGVSATATCPPGGLAHLRLLLVCFLDGHFSVSLVDCALSTLPVPCSV